MRDRDVAEETSATTIHKKVQKVPQACELISRSPSGICRHNPTACHSCAALHEAERRCSAAIWIGSCIALAWKVSKAEPLICFGFWTLVLLPELADEYVTESQLSPREDELDPKNETGG
jgi:hypothetical protein